MNDIRNLVSEVICGTKTVDAAEQELRARTPSLYSVKGNFTKCRSAILDHPDSIDPDAKVAIEERIAALDKRKSELQAFLKLPLRQKMQRSGITNEDDMAFIRSIKLEPDYLSGFKLSGEEYADLNRASEERAAKKQRSIITIPAPTLLEWARTKLTLAELGGIHDDDIAIALGIVTGRRMVELLCTGTFTTAEDDHHVIFGGHAKTKVGSEPTPPYVIPVLARPQDIIGAREILREKYQGLGPTEMNTKHCKRINDRLYGTFHLERFTFHSTRTFYLLASYEAFKPHAKTINAWGQDVLGHSNVSQSVDYVAMELSGVEEVRGTKSGM